MRVTRLGAEMLMSAGVSAGVRDRAIRRGSPHLDLDHRRRESFYGSSTDGFVQLSAKGVRMPLTQPMVEAYSNPR